MNEFSFHTSRSNLLYEQCVRQLIIADKFEVPVLRITYRNRLGYHDGVLINIGNYVLKNNAQNEVTSAT